MSKKVSVVINTLNEEKNIEKCLKSVQWGDEIIVVDMYSDDKTVEIAKKLGAKVFLHERIAYVEPARQFAINKSRNEWVFVLDADEEIPYTLAEKIDKILLKEKDITHVLIPRKNIVLGKWIKYCAEWPNHQTRLFKKSLTTWTSFIHKQPIVSGKSFRIPPLEKYAIIHYYYSTIDEFINKFDVYTSQHAFRLINEKQYHYKLRYLLIKPIWEFFYRYIRSMGFKDGIQGFIHCMLMSYYYFITYAKIWELEKK